MENSVADWGGGMSAGCTAGFCRTFYWAVHFIEIVKHLCLLGQAMDGRIVCCGIISSCWPAATSEIVKRFWQRVDSCKQHYSKYRTFPFLPNADSIKCTAKSNLQLRTISGMCTLLTVFNAANYTAWMFWDTRMYHTPEMLGDFVKIEHVLAILKCCPYSIQRNLTSAHPIQVIPYKPSLKSFLYLVIIIVYNCNSLILKP